MNKKHLLIFIALFLIAIPLMTSQSLRTQTIRIENNGLIIEFPKEKTLKQDSDHIWHWRIYNSSNGVVRKDSDTFDCDFGLQQLDGSANGNFTFYEKNVSFDDNKETFFVHTNSNNLSEPGEYAFSIECRETRSDSPSSSPNRGGFASSSFIVNPSGAFPITGGEGFVILVLSSVMVLTGSLFFFISFKFENIAGRAIFLSLGSLIFLAVIFYSVIFSQQLLPEYTAITQGYETFLFIMGTLAGVGVIVFLIVIFMIMRKFIDIKKGFRDIES